MAANSELNMRMISEDSLLTTRHVCASHSVGTVPRRANRIGDRVELVQPAHAPAGSRHDVSLGSERPALAAHLLERVPQGDVGRKLLEHTKQHGAVRPRASDCAIEMVAA